MNPPHGGKLISQMLTEKQTHQFEKELADYPTLAISPSTGDIIQNIGHGILSPLTGFMTEEATLTVLESKRLPTDCPWTIPIVLDTDEKNGFSPGDQIALTLNNTGVAQLTLEEIYQIDKKEYAKQVFGTTDVKHPGVARVNNMGQYLLGGTLSVVPQIPQTFADFTLYPMETRVLFKERGWRTIVAFQTRNPPHLGHEYVEKTALTFVDGIFINPLIGPKKTGDFRDDLILDAYRALMQTYFLKKNSVLSILRSPMYYGGPREAIHHAIMRKNFGCTHFIVGRDHAGVGNYYPPFAAQEIFADFPDLGITPLPFKSFFYCNKCQSIANDKTCPHPNSDHINFSGTKIRQYFNEGKIPPDSLMRREVAEVIAQYDDPFVK
ncbi:MAG: sulfate adenylyltransferase [Candidatus Hermodarchaeia archaeon]|jgi:sulfate adenylyltransferase